MNSAGMVTPNHEKATTDETRINRDEHKHIRVSSVFHPWLPLPSNERIQFRLQPRQDLIVRESSQLLTAAFEIDEVRPAPEAEVGVVRFAGAVHATAHHGDRD